MPLNWSVEDCLDYPSLLENREYAITETLVFATMAIGMNEITTANAGEFYSRVSILKGILGSIGIYKGDTGVENIEIIPEDIYKRIGLTTNASTLTKAKFLAYAFDRGTRAYDRFIAYDRPSVTA